MLDNFSLPEKIQEGINTVLERENKKIYYTDEAIIKLKTGDILKISSFEYLKGKVRFQVWKGNTPIGLIPNELNETLLSMQDNYEIIGVFGGLIPKQEKRFDCLIKIVFKGIEKVVEKIEVQPENEHEFTDFKVPESENDNEPFGKSFSSDIKKPFYKQEGFITLMCILCMPLGFYLLWRYGRRSAGRKAFICVSLLLTVTVVFFGFKVGFKIYEKSLYKNKPEIVAGEFLNQWQRNDWVNMLEQTSPSWRKDGGSAYKLSQWFENYKDIEDYSISEIYKDGDKTVCVAVVVINSKRYRIKFNITEEQYRHYVDVKDLRSYIDLLEITSVDTDFSSEDKEGTTYCYADGSNMIYHYSNNCFAAGEKLVRIPEGEALYRHYGPCGRCAR